MSQKAVELILMRQLASYLAMPILLFDPAGNLLYYNEPAEAILGRRFDETGQIPLEARPLVIALQKHQAAHRTFRIQAFDGIVRRIAATAFPLEGQGARHLGAVVIFWEESRP